MKTKDDGKWLNAVQCLIDTATPNDLLSFIHKFGARFDVKMRLTMDEHGEKWHCRVWRPHGPDCAGGGRSAQQAMKAAIALYLLEER